MARSEARLQFGIWRGLDELSPEAKLLYVVVLTEATLNYAGVCALRERRWAKSSGLTHDQVDKALHELQDSRHLVVDEDTEEVLVRTFIRNDGVAQQPNLLKAALREAAQIASKPLRRVLAAELRKLPPKPADTPKMRYPDPHAAAAELDPSAPVPDPPGGGRPDDVPAGASGVADPIPEPIPDGIGEPIGKPSGTHPEIDRTPRPDPPNGRHLGSLPESHPGTPGGWGRGRGRGSASPSGATHPSEAAAAATRAHASAPARPRESRAEHVPAAQLAKTASGGSAYVLVASWAETQPRRPASGHRRRLIGAVDALLRQGIDPDLVPAALTEAHQPRFRDPVAALPLAYEDVRRRVTPQPATGIDARIAAFLADEPPPESPRLRAIGGVA